MAEESAKLSAVDKLKINCFKPPPDAAVKFLFKRPQPHPLSPSDLPTEDLAAADPWKSPLISRN